MRKNTKSFAEWTTNYVRDNIDKLKAPMVQDRKTGEMYDPQVKFEEMLTEPEIMEVFKRMANR